AGNLFIADYLNDRVRQVTPSGTISTVAGSGQTGYSGDGGQATASKLFSPVGVAVDSAGNLYIADLDNDRVRKVTPEGIISTIAGTGVRGFNGDGTPAMVAQLQGPTAVAEDAAGNQYIADTANNRIRKVSPSGDKIITIAGTGEAGYSG